MECLRTARQASYQFYRKNNCKHDIYEILGEAQLAMCEALKTFQEDRGTKVESWVGRMVHRELNKKFSEELEIINFDEGMTSNFNYNPEKMLIIKETLENFSEVAKDAIQIIFDYDIDLNKKNRVKQEIKGQLRSKGYSWNRIQIAFNELRTFANSLA